MFADPHLTSDEEPVFKSKVLSIKKCKNGFLVELPSKIPYVYITLEELFAALTRELGD